MDNENKSKYESTIKWVIEHYPFDKISNIFDITQNISDLKLPEEELENIYLGITNTGLKVVMSKKDISWDKSNCEINLKNRYNVKLIGEIMRKPPCYGI